MHFRSCCFEVQQSRLSKGLYKSYITHLKGGLAAGVRMSFSILFLIGRLKKMAWKWGVGGLRRLKIAWYSFCTASSALLLLLTTDFYLAVLILLPQCLRSHISGICFHYVIKRTLIYLTSLCAYRDQLVFTSGVTNTLFWLWMLRNNASPYSTHFAKQKWTRKLRGVS